MTIPKAGDAIMICGTIVEHFGSDLMVRFDAPGLANKFLVNASDVAIDRENLPPRQRNLIILRAAYRDRAPAPPRRSVA